MYRSRFHINNGYFTFSLSITGIIFQSENWSNNSNFFATCDIVVFWVSICFYTFLSGSYKI